MEELGFELPNPEKRRSKTNNRKVVFDSACRTMFLDICKRHGLELDEEPSYVGRKYLEKQDYIRMKQKEEIADQQETILMQIDKVNENRLELAKQSSHVRANEEIIQSQKEKIKQQDTEFANNSDRIFKQGDLIEEQKNQLEKLTLEIDDIESLLQDVSDVAYEKAVEEVTNEVMIKTRQDDIQLIEGTKNWIDQPQRKASEKEKNYAKNRLDGVIKKIMKAMTAVQTVKDSLLQSKTKVKVVNEIKEKARPSIMSRLAEKKKELAERVRKLKETGGSLAQIFVIILKTIDYYSVAEIEQLKEILNTLGKQSVCERLKARGDGYLNAGYYFAAVRCYESIIKDYKGKDLLAADYAKVYHNLGTAYARMFMYDKAVIYYDEAYRTGQHEESKKCSIAALIMAKKDKEPVNVDVDEDEYVVQKELETLMDNARYSDEYRELEDIARLKADGNLAQYNRAVDERLDRWRTAYIKYSKTF